jgi:UDP-glucose 4-epimerase
VKRVLVTGANGFLGRHVVAELLDRGHEVRAMARPSADLDELGWPGSVEVFRADLRVDDLGAAFDGVDVLIHLAAAMRGTAQEQMASTVEGTGRLLAAMGRSRTGRLVLVSSLSVYDWSATVGTLTEDSPLEADLGQRDAYAAAKSEQERLVRREAAAKGWALTVLRPGYIWGPGHTNLPGLGQKVGPLYLVIGPSTRLPLTYVENCASCCVEAAENPRAVGQTLNVIDDDEQRAWSFLGEQLRRSGGRAWRVPVPYGLAMAACRTGHALLGKVVRTLPGLLVPRRFEARFKPLRFSNRKARELLGWRPPLDFAESQRRTYERAGAGQSSASPEPKDQAIS